jgi:hypothetical protein
MEEGTMAAIYGIQHTSKKIEKIFHVYFDLGLLDFFLTKKAKCFRIMWYVEPTIFYMICEYERNTKIAD